MHQPERAQTNHKQKAHSFISPTTFPFQNPTETRSKRRKTQGEQPDFSEVPQFLLNQSISSVAANGQANSFAEIKHNKTAQLGSQRSLKKVPSTDLRDNSQVQSPLFKDKNLVTSRTSSKATQNFESTKSTESQTANSSDFPISPIKISGVNPTVFSSFNEGFANNSSLLGNCSDDSSLSNEDSTPLIEEFPNEDFFRQSQNKIAQKIKDLGLHFVSEFHDLQPQFTLMMEHIGFAEERERFGGFGICKEDKNTKTDFFSKFLSFIICSQKTKESQPSSLYMYLYFANLKYDSLDQPDRFRWFFSLLAMTANAYRLGTLKQNLKNKKTEPENSKNNNIKPSLISNFFESSQSELSESLENLGSIDGLWLLCVYRFIEKHFECFGRVVAFLKAFDLDFFEFLVDLKEQLLGHFNLKIRDKKWVKANDVLDTFVRLFLRASEESIQQLHVKNKNYRSSLHPPSILESAFRNSLFWKTHNSYQSSSYLRAHIESQGF